MSKIYVKMVGAAGFEPATKRSIRLILLALILLTECLLNGCGGGADGIKVMPLDWQYQKATTEWSVYGDSSAAMLGKVWIDMSPSGNVTNYGIGGATIGDFLDAPDKYMRKKAVWLIGGNDIQRGRSTDDIVEGFFRLFATFKAERVFCVAIGPQFRNPEWDAQIIEINEHLKGMCGQGYVDSWALYKDGYLMDDGLHHTEDFDMAIIAEILWLDSVWE